MKQKQLRAVFEKPEQSISFLTKYVKFLFKILLIYSKYKGRNEAPWMTAKFLKVSRRFHFN